MANHASHAALPYPVKNARFTIPVPYLDADGDPTDPTTPDTEISKDGAAFADCAEEVTTITGSNGAGYLTLSGAEMDCSLAVVAAKVASGPKATLMTLYPRVLPVIYSGTASAGAAGTLTLVSIPAVTSFLVGCILKTTGGTGGGGTGGANNQARVITAFDTSLVASVTPNWETTPDNTTTYQVLLTDAAYIRLSDVRAWEGTLLGASDAAGYPKVTIKDGTGAGELDLTTGNVNVDPSLLRNAVGLATGNLDDQFANVTSRLSTLVTKTGEVGADGGNSATTFFTSLTETSNDHYKDALIKFTSGTLAQQVKKITAYNGTTKFVTVAGGFTATPTALDTFEIIND